MSPKWFTGMSMEADNPYNISTGGVGGDIYLEAPLKVVLIETETPLKVVVISVD